MARRKKKKLNRGLLIALCSAIALILVGGGMLAALKLLPRDAGKLYSRAQEAIAEGDRREAWGLWRAAVHHSRKDIATNQKYRMEFVAFLFEWLRSDKQLSDEMRSRLLGEWRNQLVAILENDPKHTEARTTLTDFYWARAISNAKGDTEVWERFLESAAAQSLLTPDSALLHYRMALGHSLLAKTRPEHHPKALGSYAMAITAAPADPMHYTEWVRYLAQQKYMETKAPVLAPDGNMPVETMQRRIADLAEALGQGEPAPRRSMDALEKLTPVDVYRLGLAANPESVTLHVALAEYQFFAKGEAASTDDFKIALAIEPKSARDLMAIASFYRHTASSAGSEHVAKAVEYYARARQADPSLTEATVGQIQMHLARREFAEAERIAREGLAALESEPTTREALDRTPEEVRRIITRTLQLNASLAQALMGQLPEDQAQRDKVVAQIQQCIARCSEKGLANIEDGVHVGPMAIVQRQLTKVRARLALLNGKDYEAEDLYRRVYETSPALDFEVGWALVSLYGKHDQETESLRMLVEITNRFPREVRPWLLLIRLSLAQRKLSRAVDAIEKVEILDLTDEEREHLNGLRAAVAALKMQAQSGEALVDMPEDIEEMDIPKWLSYAQRLSDSREPAEAMKVVERLHESFPANEMVVRALVGMYMSDDRDDLALKVVETALAADPDSERLAFLKRVLNTPAEQREQMLLRHIQQVEEGLDRELQLADFYRRRGAEGDLEKCYEHMEKALAIDPQHPRLLSRLFGGYLVARRFDDAERLAQLAAGIGSQGLEGTKGKVFEGQILIIKEQWAEAVEVLQEAIAMRPRFGLAHSLLGEAYLNTGQIDEAAENFKISYDLNNRDVRTLLGLAHVADRQGNTEEHRKWIFAAYPHAPTVPYIRRHWLAYRRELVGPLQFLRDCVSLYQRYSYDMEVVLMLAQAYERLPEPDYAQAEDIYRKSYDHLKDGPEQMRYLSLLVSFLQRIGKSEEAEALLDESFKTVKDEDRLEHSLLRVQFLMGSKRYEEAKAIIDRLVSDHPDDARPLRFAAQWSIDTGEDWSVGVQAMKKVVELEPDDPLVRQQYFEILMRSGRHDEAITELQQSIEQNPNDDEAMALLAHSYQLLGRTDEAMAMCDRAITTNPKQVRARALRSDILFAAGDKEASLLDLEEAYKARPNEAVALLKANRLFEAYPDGTRAKLALVEALTSHIESVRLLRRLAEICLATRDWREMDKAIEKGRRLTPRSPVWPALEAERWRVVGQPRQRAARMKMAYDLDRTSMGITFDYIDSLFDIEQYGQVQDVVVKARTESREARTWLLAAAGRAHVMMGNTEQGLGDFQASLQTGRRIDTISAVARHFYAAVGDEKGMALLTQWTRDSKLAGPRMVLAMKLIQTKQLDAAIRVLAGVDLDSSSPHQKLWTLRTSGQMQYSQGRYTLARKAYEKALALAEQENLSKPFLLNNLAYMLVENLNDPAPAVQYAEKAVELEPTNPNMVDTLGWVYFRTGRPDDAIVQLKRSLAITETPAALYHLGRVYASMNRSDEAERMYVRGFDLVKDKPDDPFHDLLRNQLRR